MNVISKDHQRKQGNDAPIPDPVTNAVKPGDLVLGDPDPDGKEVDDIYMTTDRYQIYLANNEVRYLLEKDEKKAAKLRKSLHEISHERETIEYQRKHRAIGSKDRNHCARLLARCMARTFEGNADTARAVLVTLGARLSAKIQSHSRMKYAIGSGYALSFVLAGIIVLLFVTGPEAQQGPLSLLPVDPSVLAAYAKLCIFGALGAFLSVSIGIRNISFDLNLSKAWYIYAGGIRIVIGVIGAIVVGLALDSKLLAPTFSTATGQPVYYLMAFLAGFSETLVPNVLRKAEKTSGATNAQAAPQAEAPAA